MKEKVVGGKLDPKSSRSLNLRICCHVSIKYSPEMVIMGVKTGFQSEPVYIQGTSAL